MQGLRELSGSGEYAPGERHLAVVGERFRPGEKPLVVFFTGAAGNERRFLEDEYEPLATALAGAGYPVASAEFGRGYLWGNEIAQQRIEQLHDYGLAELGARSGGLLGVGVSKGATALLNYARSRPGRVAAVAALIPAVEVAAIHDADGRLGAEIEAAYGGPAGYRERVADLDPSANVEELRALPLKCWYSDDDAIPAASVREFAERAGGEAESIGPAGHSIVGLDPGRVLSFFESALARQR